MGLQDRQQPDRVPAPGATDVGIPLSCVLEAERIQLLDWD